MQWPLEIMISNYGYQLLIDLGNMADFPILASAADLCRSGNSVLPEYTIFSIDDQIKVGCVWFGYT
jgi:2',3'-cyclic-nucleotide 2'-phosphodiesterase (5'-nucleotidase family)